jgi:hypothetical protein
MRFHYCFSALALVLTGCQPEVRFSTVRSEVVRLPSGDSVLSIATGPIFAPNGDTGFMYEYHPYIPLTELDRLRPQVLELWHVVKPRAESLRAPFVVLRATNRLHALPIGQPALIQNYGFVFESRPGGLWYFLNDSLLLTTP